MTSKNPPKSKRGSLNVDLIAQTALRVADEEGLEALTIRRMAREFGVTPMALYRHVDSAAHLETLAFQQAITTHLDWSDTGDWRHDLKVVMKDFRDLMLKHPGAGQSFVKNLIPTEKAARNQDHLFGRLLELGVPTSLISPMFHALIFFNFGNIAQSLTRQEHEHTRFGDVLELHDQLPHLQGVMRDIRATPADETYEAALDFILDACEAAVERHLAASDGDHVSNP